MAALTIMACVDFIESLQIVQYHKQDKLEAGISRAAGFTTPTRCIFQRSYCQLKSDWLCNYGYDYEY